MTNTELNEQVAQKLFPSHPVVINGSEVWCKDKVIDFRKPHLMERMLHELEDVTLTKIDGGWSVNADFATTMSRAIALAYVHA